MTNGLYLTHQLDVEVNPAGINMMTVKGLPSPPSIKNNIRYFSISKSLDAFNFNEEKIKSINQKIKNILGDNLNSYKFIISLEKEESITTIERIDTFKKMIDNPISLVITINIEEIKNDSVVFLNNPSWILSDIDNKFFFEIWRYLKTKDLGTIKKKFMFLNNHYSEIRFDILKFIYKNKFNLEGNISFNYIDFNQNHINFREEDFKKQIEHYGIEYPKFYDALPTLSQITEKEISRKDLVGINHVATMADFNYRIYLESFFEIITETDPHINLPGVHISEKIHRPLRTALPFVYYGNPKLKKILENIGLTFNSPMYFFGLDRIELFEHLKYILSKDMGCYHQTQLQYIDEYFNNMDKWIEFVNNNNKQILKFMYT